MVHVNVSAYKKLSTEGAFIFVDTDITCSKISTVEYLPSFFSLALVIYWKQFTADTKKKLFRSSPFPLYLPAPMSTLKP